MKKILLTSFLMFLAALSAWAGDGREYISLDSRLGHGGNIVWHMIRDGETKATAREISMPGFKQEGWAEAIVPATVLTNLVEQKVYPEPYYGQTNKLANNTIPDIANVGREFYTYWFRTEFTVPAEYKGKRIWLEPMGINYRAEVWVNGYMIGTMAGMFNSQPFDITDRAVQPGQTSALAIRVFPVDVPGTTAPKYWGAVGEWHNGGDGWMGQNVSQLMTVGWDFTFEDGIRDRNTGIWRSIRLYATGGQQLRSPFVRSELSHPNYDEARETVSVEVWNPNTGGGECTVTGTIEEFPQKEGRESVTFRKEKLKLQRGEHITVSFSPKDYPQLVIKNPRLWWPKNKGPQNLYTLRLTLTDGKGNVMDSLSTCFGIREVVATRETPDKSKLFLVNGHKTFVRGTNWIPEAMLRTNDQRMETELAYTDQCGVNLLRLWGGGIAESDRFYELCDEYGIMVWQEFWMTGDTKHPMDEPLYLANVENTMKRIRNHPSIVIYVSSNESTAVTGAEELIRSLAPDIPYQMQSECDGVHDGSPYKQVNPMRHYENTASDRGSRVDGFNPEYGAPTLPIVEDLYDMMPREDLWPINKATWDYMDGNGFHLMTTLYKDMVDQYGESKSIEEFARRGQMVGAINSKSIWEVWNENKLQYGDRWCSGLLFWYHNCPNWQICARLWDWFLEPTASLYHTMHALEPIHIQYDYLKGTVSVINDYVEAQKGLKAKAEVYDLQSRKVGTVTAKVDVPADGVVNDILTIAIPDGITPVHFIALELTDAKGNVVSRNFYWRSTNKYEGKQTVTGPCTGGFEPLSTLPEAKPNVTARRLADKDGFNQWEVTVKNGGKRIAFFCQLLLTDMQDKPIHSTFYSDNFFSLLPGEKQVITIRTPRRDGQSYRLRFCENMGAVKSVALK
ncbi:MAG: glycoside hydrolase family 2 [Bacteroidaceae bacterium]|nr:glycoside hydrolase family 2 [Bacteroidaceae bacterium]